MAVAWRRARAPSLESQKWRVLTIGGEQYLIKALFEDQGYHVMISNLSTVWEEDIGAEKILRKAKRKQEEGRLERSLNPNVEAPLSVLLSNLSSNIEETPPNASFSISSTGSASPDAADSIPPDIVSLTLYTSLSSLPFEWEFMCSKAPPKILSSHLIEPLLCMVGELQRRQLELNKILVKKDKEIQDYKEQGTQVSRKTLETAPFDTKAFANEMITSSYFEETVQQPFGALSDPAFHELYRDIVMVQKWAARKDEFMPIEGGDLDSATTGTWAGKIPASLPPTLPPSSHTSPTAKSPTKARETISELSHKDGEQDRREALKRKLEEEKTKSKKKKKKLV